MSDAPWMIYGANGYTGRLTAEEAVRRGQRPVLAGRRRAVVETVARELGLESRVFGLDDPADLGRGLEGMGAVLHCAGPFSVTSGPMVAGCAAAGAHYLDITGEIDVFEAIHGESERWAEAGIVAMPGVGFDVVPSDCLAAMLARELPGATHLELAFFSTGRSSPGTTKTMVEGLPVGTKVREQGVIVSVPSGTLVKTIPFTPTLLSEAAAIPWGDVSTAYHSTGIPNIVVYMGLPERAIRAMGLLRFAAPLLRLEAVQRFLKGQVERRVEGPSEDQRERAESRLWGEVRDGAGKRAAMRMRTPNGYSLTVDSSLRAVERLLASTPEQIPRGAQTPSRAFGPDFVLECDGVEVERA